MSGEESMERAMVKRLKPKYVKEYRSAHENVPDAVSDAMKQVEVEEHVCILRGELDLPVGDGK